MKGLMMGVIIRVVALAAALTALSAADAATILFNVPSGDWFNPTNWSGSLAPTATDDAYVNNGGTASITLPGAVCNGLGVGSAGGSYVQMVSGSLVVGSNVWLAQDESSNDYGSFTQSGGTVSAACLWMGGPWGARGTYYLTGGQLNLSGEAYEGITLGLQIGQSAPGSTFAQSGGTLNVAGIIVGGGWESSGAYNLTAGQVIAGTEAIGMDQRWGSGSSGTFTQSGGTNSVTSLVLGYFGGDSGTFNLNGGLLDLAAAPSLGGGAGTFNFGGGTLAASAPWSSSLNMTLTGSGGAGTVDTTGGNISLSGILSGSGGLTKVGAGTLTLTGSNTYSGSTTVDGGTLQIVGGSLASPTQYVGYSGTGALLQSGGVNALEQYQRSALSRLQLE